MKRIMIILMLGLFSMTLIAQTKVTNCDSVIAAFKAQLHQKHDSIVKVRNQLTTAQAKKDLWGDVSPISYLIGLIFAFIGIFINTYVLTVKSVKAANGTPQKFSWIYWWNENHLRILRWIGLLFVILIAMRFSNEILNVKFTMFVAFGLGLGLDRLVEVIKNLKNKLPAPTV